MTLLIVAAVVYAVAALLSAFGIAALLHKGIR